ncbi:anthranilate phosphoribosyltransferase [Nocardioidaceae bacterium]|nr:anthranilate phosphoribosyltransferase [Nocardioidaceae bacterium]
MVASRRRRRAPDRPGPAHRRRRTPAAARRGRRRARQADGALTVAAGHSWPDLLSRLVAGEELDGASTAWAMEQVLGGAATPSQIAGFVVALRAKGETVAEVEGLVAAMMGHCVPLEVPGRCLDVVGTGGDRSMSVNISTMAAIVAAGAGARVVKHGNRSASSKTGTADVLEHLGIGLDLPAAAVGRLATEVGMTFCFAAAFHPAMRHAAIPRRELGIATTMNFLGPLANPVQPAAQAIGCADAAMAPVMAGVLARRGVDAWVFRGDDGLDELTTTTTSRLWVVEDGVVSETVVDPARLGLPPATAEDLRGDDVAFNAEVVRRLVAGERGPVRDAVVLNAGAALAVHAADQESAATQDVEERLRHGMARAERSLDDGAAADLLARWITASRAA